MSRSLGSAVAIVLAFANPVGAAPAADPAGMLRAADAPREAFHEGVIRLRGVVNERGKPPSENRMEIFVSGGDKSLAVFREGKQQGRKILTVGDRAFLIVPGSSRPVPVSKTQRLMGAASFGDIARLRFADEYVATLRPADEAIAENAGETRCHVLDLTAARKGSAYPTAVLWIGRDDGLARRLRLSMASGKEAKDVRFLTYDDKGRIATMEIRDLLSESHASVTSLVFEGYEQQALDPAIFGPEGARAVP
jgi:hypothetical protein